MPIRFLGALLLCAFASTSTLVRADEANVACRSSPALVAPCYDVRGRLFLANGTPGFRIWRFGTKRILGVLDSTGHLSEGRELLLPASVQRLLQSPYGEVDGIYTVCPFTKSLPGQMQNVCIAAVRSPSAKK